ncbi:uncharacterized protein [Aegilops tauschii subsp. strangulata]|uniref:Uncharacterized protein n=1 Tax=Aegilops tauschii subsp. strangulata TaxID=200361 RepID=A0A453QVJ8_AEGTS|nr:uncharacterized protein LOC109755402 [Aegilops tauschii subsp. strangulata]
MDSIVIQGWTSSQVEEARSLIARLNTNKIMYNANDDKNKKHNYIVNSLHALFPSKTMQQVIDIYVDLAMEMHMIQLREGTHVTGGSPQNMLTFCEPVNGNYELPGEKNGASNIHGVYTMGDHANGNFGVREEEATIVDNNGLSFGCVMEDTGITVTGEAPLMVDNNKMVVLVNNISIDQPVVAPHQWDFWTNKEHSMGDLVNENFEVQEDEDTNMDDNGFPFRCALEDTRITKTEEARMMADKNKMVLLENNTSNDRPAVAPHQRKLWTIEEHKSFLYGLEIYGRGDWKNISKHFVTTKTPVQVSSHAQKFFKRIQKKASSGTKRYSINDVRLHDNELLAANNSSVPRQALSFTGLNNDPSFRLQAPTSSLTVMNNQAQCSPSTYNQQVDQQPMWSEQQMMGSVAAVMDGIGNYVPDGQQGPAYFYLGNV